MLVPGCIFESNFRGSEVILSRSRRYCLSLIKDTSCAYILRYADFTRRFRLTIGCWIKELWLAMTIGVWSWCQIPEILPFLSAVHVQISQHSRRHTIRLPHRYHRRFLPQRYSLDIIIASWPRPQLTWLLISDLCDPYIPTKPDIARLQRWTRLRLIPLLL